MQTITGVMTIRLLEVAVARKGYSYVYTNPDEDASDCDMAACRYLHGDEPGCLVGHVMKMIGVPDSILRDNEGKSAREIINFVEDDVSEDEQKFEFTGAARQILNVAQSLQDGGKPWGETLEYVRGNLAKYEMYYIPNKDLEFLREAGSV